MLPPHPRHEKAPLAGASGADNGWTLRALGKFQPAAIRRAQPGGITSAVGEREVSGVPRKLLPVVVGEVHQITHRGGAGADDFVRARLFSVFSCR